MPDCVTDTHALIWYLEASPRLSETAKQIFEACDRGQVIIYVPTICLVEMIYLAEKGRIPAPLVEQFIHALLQGETGLVPMSLTEEVAIALPRIPRAQVPDLPDRIIAATALVLGLPLMSRDRQILLSEVETIW
jgi:PIN domain nuclease of toxin-antitoxin system